MSFWSSAGLFPALYGHAPHGYAPWGFRFAGIRGTVGVAFRTVLTRRALDGLDDRALADIGLSRGEAEQEARRAPWDIGPPRRRASRPGPRRQGTLELVGLRLREALRRRRSRQAISELNQRMLKDIGVSYAEAEFEANKPFWRS